MATPQSAQAIRISNQTAIWYMAQSLVDGLERWCKVKSGSLPDGSECCVCKEEYDEADFAVRLPCKHVVGYQCIRKWLFEELHSTCPLCREFFYPAYPHDHLYEYDLGDDPIYDWESDSDSVYNWGSDSDSVHNWGPDSDSVYDWGSDSDLDGDSYQRPFCYSQHEIYRPYQRVSDELTKQNFDPVIETLPSERVARKRREIHMSSPGFEDVLLYFQLLRKGADLPPKEDICKDLSKSQYDAILSELERRGAFNQYHHEHPEISDIGQMKDNLVTNGFWYRPEHDGSVKSRPGGWFRWTEFGAGWPSEEEVDRFRLMRFYDSRPWWRAGANEWQRVADESELF
ncbi:hypothetical protein IMSHALPRED_007236 [Imshaugia aleurites]|uniref:RING-type domain-containing protein n=1 Tax=Imshaugia aleurites TaxID=172621 RepID=A0A8H3FPF8_9LECA|nr:hypothetical protein IMSHALPRED_007236 [Imshaugia aleurites]